MTTRAAAATLFVYGSLLEPARRIAILGRDVATRPAALSGYVRGRARYFYIKRQPGAVTPGLLLFDLTAADRAALDRYEEVPVLYTFEMVEVTDFDGQTHRCGVYMPTPRMLSGG